MYLIHTELTIIVFIAILQWTQINVQKRVCCKDNSRFARKIVQSKWSPIFKNYNVKIPLECPLHMLRDYFGPRERIKKKNRPTQWTCKKCGKSFFEEKFLDIHFENRHNHLVNEGDDAICFADFCDVMRCDVLSSDESILPFGVSEKFTDIEVWGDLTNHVSQFSSISSSYSSSALPSERKKKSLLMHKSSSSSSSPAMKNDVHSNFHGRKLCQEKLELQNKYEKKIKLKRDDRKDYSNSKNKKHNSSEQNNTSTSNENFPNHLHKSSRNNCKPDEIAKIKLKCESLVRTCMTGLLLKMSDISYREMEEELNKAVCWYLTCDRYWEDGSIEPRMFPWGLILAIVVILSLGICFCYYIIWILFDSGDSKYQMIDNNQMMHHYGTNLSQRPITGGVDRQPIYNPELMKYGTGDNQMYNADAFHLQNNEHYIYVTYPAEMKGRLIEKYE